MEPADVPTIDRRAPRVPPRAVGQRGQHPGVEGAAGHPPAPSTNPTRASDHARATVPPRRSGLLEDREALDGVEVLLDEALDHLRRSSRPS